MENNLYDNIKLYCTKRNISIRQLETRAGIGNGSIQKWKNHSPVLSNVQSVADVLGVTVNTLLK